MNSTVVRQALEAALETEQYGTAESRRDVAFHMTDWLADLERFHAYCQAPSTLDSEQTTKLLIDFLVHVPNHLAAASKLLTGIPVTDVFDVGATTDND